MSQARITVVIPAHNIAGYIGAAIESALRQDPPFARIIVIDDGSTDATRAAIAKYADPRILFHRQENRGLGETRNVGIELADTEFLYFFDGDDVLLPGLTAAFQRALDAHPSLDLFAFSALDFADGSGELLPDSRFVQRRRAGVFASGEAALRDRLRDDDFPPYAWLYVLRRSVLEGETRLRFLPILHEDEPFTPALFLRCGSSVIATDVLLHRRVRQGSITTSRPTARNVEGFLAGARWWLHAAETRHETRDFRLRAHKVYQLALDHAIAAGLGPREFARMVKATTPQLARHAANELRFARLSTHAKSQPARKLARSAYRLFRKRTRNATLQP